MDISRGRQRRRKHIDYDDVVPSTDLPPLVEGELRCFLFVTIGELAWGTTTTNKVPPASPVYIRLRWWGEASNGTYFRPQSKKSQKTVKCRAQFGIRSGPKQISAYFNDMGSATFDVLSSPTSLPIGRVLVPGVSSLSSSNPIRGFFPIMSASSRKLGELQISISFKPLRAAYDDSSDAMTDASYSARSRTASVGGGNGSRKSSQSRASSVASNKSRSSSRGSRSCNDNIGRRKRSSSGKSTKKRRSRSRSTDSKASLEASRHEIPTPRGIDALLERNGHNLYGRNKEPPTSNKGHQAPIKTTVSLTNPAQNVHVDAISELLKRGRKLREEISRSKNPDHPASPVRPQPSLPDQAILKQPTQGPVLPPTTVTTASASAPTMTTYASPTVPSQKSSSNFRILDMFFKGNNFRTSDVMTPDLSTVSSPQYSIVSESDDPLHDESMLQHLFYTNTNEKSRNDVHKTVPDEDSRRDNEDLMKQPHSSSDVPTKLASRENENNTKKLESVSSIRISVHNLQLTTPLEDEDDEVKRNALKNQRGRRAKPPMASQVTPQQAGRTFFVEYKFPHTVPSHKSIAATSSNLELTRLATRKVNKEGLVQFDQDSSFNIHFNSATLSKWRSENIQFVVYQKRPKDKKASILGSAVFPLKEIVDGPGFSFHQQLRISPSTSDRFLSAKVYGRLKVSIDLVDASKETASHAPPSKQSSQPSVPPLYSRTVTRSPTRQAMDSPQKVGKEMGEESGNSPRACVEDSHVIPDDDGVCPRITSTVLYLYIMLERARNIPATKLQSGPSVGKSCAPNIYLVCRTFATDEAASSAVSWNSSNPKFAFTQVIPVKINNQLFTRLRNNYVVVEVWTKIPSEKRFSDKLLGLVKIPLQLFYQSLKDSEVARAVLKSEYPLVSVDGYQSIVDVFSGNERGQLKVLLALGTQTQVNTLRKMTSSEDRIHHLDEGHDESVEEEGGQSHSFEITVHGLRGFEPHDTQVWGETDCFIQYRFPAQHSDETSEDSTTTDEDGPDTASLQCFRSDTTLCVPNPQFNYTKKHVLHPSPHQPINQLLCSPFPSTGKQSGGGVEFEVWSRHYYPNVRDQLLAKGSLPAAKLNAVVTMSNKRVSKQSFQVPMKYVDPDSGPRAAGDLNVTIKYKSSTQASQKVTSQSGLPFYKNVKLQIAVLRACGLKAAAKLKASLTDDRDLDYCAEIGVNSYVKINASFSPSHKLGETRCVARSFSPDYNHHFELDCPVLAYGDQANPSSLAAQLAGGEISLEVWHKPIVEDLDGQYQPKSDVLLGRIQIPTCSLLYKTTGCSSWYPMTSIESLRHKSSSTVGAVELAMSFSCRNDLDVILRAAKAVAWSPPFKCDLNRLLTPTSSGVLKPVEDPDTSGDFVTTCITVTNAWLPKHLLTLPHSEEINKHAHIYLRYKFFDKDTVVSSICPAQGASERKTFKQHDVYPVKLAHRKSFLCHATHPLVWYLREESLQVQVWFSHSRSSRTRKRPFDADRLLGTAVIDLSSVLIGGLHRQQHISGLYPLFKAGVDELGDAAIRVYLSLSPGDHTQSYDHENLDDTSTSTDTDLLNGSKDGGQIPTVKSEKADLNQGYFSAIVSVERAMHLVSLPSDGDEEVRPSCYVTYPVADVGKTVEATRVAFRSSCPVWDDAKEVRLDRKILDKDSGNLLFRVWQRDGSDEASENDKIPLPSSDKVIGFATVDISVLQAGFRAVNGWYNILDIHGHCQGQIKLAVTPTEPLYIAGKTDSLTGPSLGQVSPNKGILHSVPLLGPVQTPSGSMYYPGVSASKQAIDSIGNMLNDVIISNPITTQSPSLKSGEDAVTQQASINIDAMPSRAMFQHDSQSALQSALQRQMKELDQIKEAFMNKRRPGEYKPDGEVGKGDHKSENKTAPGTSEFTPLSAKSSEGSSSSDTSSSDSSEVGSSSDSDVPTPRASPAKVHQKTKQLPGKLNSSTPERSKTTSTVHLSLFKPDKDRLSDFDGAVLSDNEMSDVEFVNPVNLNDGSCLFPSSGPQLHDSDHQTPLNEVQDGFKSSPDPFSVTPPVHGSTELDNTSLWLSASQADASGREHSGTDGETTAKDDGTAPNSPSPLHEGRSSIEEDGTPPTTPQNDVSDPPPPSTSSHEVEEEEASADVGGEEEEEVAVTDAGVEPNQNDVPKISDVARGKEDPDPEIEDDRKSSEDEDDHPSDDDDSDSSSSLSDSDDTVVDNIEVADHCNGAGAPTMAPTQPDPSPNPSQPPTEWTHVPSFFPPSRDLLASMKTLQAITTEQKHKLLKQEEVENKENNVATVQRPRRKLVRPAVHSPEQTERLARIFSTKFS